MPLSARQQTRLNYLQKRRPNDPEVAKLQGKGVNQNVLPVSRSNQAPIAPTQADPSAVDPGRYMGGSSQRGQAQFKTGLDQPFSRAEDFVRPNTRLGQAFAQGALGSMGKKSAPMAGGFKNNPYEVLKK